MAHLCLYYNNRPQLWLQCAQLIQSMPDSPWCYVADEHTAEYVQSALAEQLKMPIPADQILTGESFHLYSDVIRIADVGEALSRYLESYTSAEQDCLFFVEMTWAIRTPSGAVYLSQYEHLLDQLIARFPVTFVCLYNQHVMLDSQLLESLYVHPEVYNASGRHTNPYYLPPHVLRQQDQRAKFEHWLNTLNPAAAEASESAAGITGGLRQVYNFDHTLPLIATDTEEQGWKIRCLGDLRVYRADGSHVAWNIVSGATRKAKTLFAFLLHCGGQGASVEEIADLLWPESADFERSLNRLYHTVHCLRMALTPHIDSSRDSEFVLYQNQRYYLALPPNSWLDLPMFQEMCYRGRSHMKQQHWEEALLCYQSAERLYTGDLLADVPDKYAANYEIDWCWSRRYWYRDMYIKVMVNSAEIYRLTGRIPQALSCCDSALKSDPVNESAHQEKMRVLAASQRYDALDRQFRLYRSALAKHHIGTPTRATIDLYNALKTR